MKTQKCSLALAMILSIWAAAGAAVEPETAEPAKTCLSLWMIDDIDILDSQNIAFHMKNGDYYLNRLPQNCPMLDRTRAIMYQTPLTSLCNMDIITVLDNVAGGFHSMGSCGLGKYHPATREDILRLKKDRKLSSTSGADSASTQH